MQIIGSLYERLSSDVIGLFVCIDRVCVCGDVGPTCVWCGAKHDLKLSKWYKNTSMDTLDNGESEIVSFGLTLRVTVGHCNVFGRTSFLTSPSHTFFETY